MNYFKSKFDPETKQWSPNWYGHYDSCPDATVDLYNTKEGYALGYTDKPLVEGMEALDEKTYNALIVELSTGKEEGVCAYTKLEEKWNPKPEPTTDNVLDQADTVLAEATQTGSYPVFCDTCHRLITYLPYGIKAATINLTCPIGHKVVING